MNREIVFVSSATNMWGAERSLWTLAESLRSKGERVTLVSCDAQLVKSWRAQFGEANLIPPVNPGIRGLIKWWRVFWRTRGNTLSDRSAVVVFSLQLAPIALLLRTARLSSRPRIILDLHDSLTTRKGRLKIGLIGMAFDHVVSVSAFAASQLFAQTPVTILTRPMRLESHPCGSTLLEPRKSEVRAIGVVGRLDPDKNVEFAYDVMSQLDKSHVLILRGEASHGNEEYAQRLISEGKKHLGDRLSWQGRVDSDSVMDSLDVLLAVNPNEAMGRTILEAQLAGVPVVVPDSGGTAELVSHGDTGRKYQTENAASAAREIRIVERESHAITSKALIHARAATDSEVYADRYLTAMWT